MSRRGAEAFTPLLTILTIAILSWALFSTATADWDGEPPSIGTKQEAIYRAYQQSQGITLYAEKAALLAEERASLGGTDAQGLPVRASAAFNALLGQYPGVSMPAFTAHQQGAQLTFTASEPVEIPLRTAEGTSSISSRGMFTLWPVENTPIATSLFGPRRVSSGNPNHPGFDMHAEIGDAVYALEAGTVHLGTWGAGLEYVLLEMANGWSCEYIHVAHIPQVRDGDTVTRGQRIAEITKDPGYPVHLHLECYNPNILTPSQAESRYPGQVHGTSPLARDTLVVTNDAGTQALIDPYCLFSPEIKARLAWNDGITGYDYRPGNSDEEKREWTCRSYGSILPAAPTNDADVGLAARARYQETLENLQEEYDGDTLLEIVRKEAADAGVDPNIVLAMIAAESQGKWQARSAIVEGGGGGARGLMQMTCDTARAVLPEELPDEESCETTLYEPDINVRAGARYIRDLLDHWQPYTHSVAFLAAEYNGGGVVRGLAGPAPGRSYEDAMRDLTPERLATIPQYAAWESSERANKALEIARHGERVAAQYTLFGGSAPPSGVSRSVIGSYTFTLSAQAEIDTSLQAARSALKERLAACEDPSCADAIVAGAQAQAIYPGLQRCTNPAERVALRARQCTEGLRAQSCACPVLLPPDTILAPRGVTVGGNFSVIDWLGQGADPQKGVVFVDGSQGRETVHQTFQGVFLGDGADRIPLGDADGVYLSLDRYAISSMEDAHSIAVSTQQPASVCAVRHAEQYCSGDYRFTVTHAGTPALPTGAPSDASQPLGDLVLFGAPSDNPFPQP